MDLSHQCRAVVQTGSRRPFTSEASVRYVMFLADKVTLGRGFSQSTPVLSLSGSCHLFSILIFIYMLILSEGRTGEAWELVKSSAFSEIRERWLGKYFSFFFLRHQRAKLHEIEAV